MIVSSFFPLPSYLFPLSSLPVLWRARGTDYHSLSSLSLVHPEHWFGPLSLIPRDGVIYPQWATTLNGIIVQKESNKGYSVPAMTWSTLSMPRMMWWSTTIEPEVSITQLRITFYYRALQTYTKALFDDQSAQSLLNIFFMSDVWHTF